MSQNARPIITLFGTSKAQPGNAIYQMAEDAGRCLAKAGFDIANGGYGGTMRASAQGASEAGAMVFGVTCKAFGRSKTNEFVSREIPSESLDERLHKLIELGEGYLVLPGGTGTLLELAMVWEHKNKRFETTDKPILVFADFWSTLVERMQQADPGSRRSIILIETPEQAADILRTHFQVITL